jgi:quercetin dioxygenase-like cupin family protein
MSAFVDLGEIGSIDIWDGVVARVVDGELCSLAVVELDPGAIVAEHRHANEQLGMVLHGSVSFRVGDEERVLGPGATWRIPTDTPHECTRASTEQSSWTSSLRSATTGRHSSARPRDRRAGPRRAP